MHGSYPRWACSPKRLLCQLCFHHHSLSTSDCSSRRDSTPEALIRQHRAAPIRALYSCFLLSFPREARMATRSSSASLPSSSSRTLCSPQPDSSSALRCEEGEN